MNNLIILSLGQLNSCNTLTSIHQLTMCSVRHTNLPQIITYPFYYLATVGIYAHDLFIGKNIEKYKTGAISDTEFSSFLKNNFKGTEEELFKAWNTMVEMSASDKTNFTHLMEFLARNVNTSLLVTSSTNPSHFRYLLTQFSSLNTDFSKMFSKNGKIQFELSFDNGAVSHQQLAKSGCNKISEEGFKSIFCLNSAVRPLGVSYMFKRVDFNPKISGLRGILDGIALEIQRDDLLCL